MYASSGNSHTNGKQVHFEDDKNNKKKETKEGDNHGVEERAGTREGAAPTKPYLEAARQGLEADGLLGKHPQLAKLLQEAAEAEPAEPPAPKTPDEDELHRQHKAAVQKTKEASERKVKGCKKWSEATEWVKKKEKAAEEATEAWVRAQSERDELLAALWEAQRKASNKRPTTTKPEPKGADGSDFSYEFTVDLDGEDDTDLPEELQKKLEIGRQAKKAFEAKCKEANEQLAAEKQKHAAVRSSMETDFQKLSDELAEIRAAVAPARKKMRDDEGQAVPQHADTKAEQEQQRQQKREDKEAQAEAERKKEEATKKEQFIQEAIAEALAQGKAAADQELADKKGREPSSEEVAAVEHMEADSAGEADGAAGCSFRRDPCKAKK